MSAKEFFASIALLVAWTAAWTSAIMWMTNIGPWSPYAAYL